MRIMLKQAKIHISNLVILGRPLCIFANAEENNFTTYLFVGRIHFMKSSNVLSQILEAAESLVQTRGYHAFSFKDLSNLIGIKTSSIHYYFPTKSDLGRALVARNIEKTILVLNQIRKKNNFNNQLISYIRIIAAHTYQDAGKMCLGGMLAIDVQTLNTAIQEELQRFFHIHEKWIEETLELGRNAGEFSFMGKADIRARTIMSSIEGVLILTRLYEQDKRLEELKDIINLIVK